MAKERKDSLQLEKDWDPSQSAFGDDDDAAAGVVVAGAGDEVEEGGVAEDEAASQPSTPSLRGQEVRAERSPDSI